MTRKKRRSYTDEQKSEAVRLAEQPNRSVREVTEGLGIPPSLLSKWNQKYGLSKSGRTVVMSIDEKAELEALFDEKTRSNARNEIFSQRRWPSSSSREPKPPTKSLRCRRPRFPSTACAVYLRYRPVGTTHGEHENLRIMKRKTRCSFRTSRSFIQRVVEAMEVLA